MWAFRLPTEIVFGEGESVRISERVRALGTRALVVCDPSVSRSPAGAAAVAALERVGLFEGIEPNPTVGSVNALTALARELEADVLVAIGGGSAIDCAKAAAALAPGGADRIEAYHTGGRLMGTGRLPLVAVPTTAGTGTEVTPFAVLDDPARGIKAPLASPALYPTLAVVDPLLTASMPRYVTACTGLDALSHALEGYWSRNHQPLCDMLAKEAARLIFASLETACREPGHAQARRDMAYAALLAGMAFQLPKNAMVHACSYPLSSRYHLPHGAACAFTLDSALLLNAPAMNGRMEAFAAYCGFETVAAMAAAIRRLKQTGGLPCTLAEAGIAPEAIDELVAESFHPLMKNNPVEITKDDLKKMYMGLAGSNETRGERSA